MSASSVRLWVVLTWLLLGAVFSQSIFAGFLLSGDGWGRTAHGFTALALVATTFVAGIAAAVALRQAQQGRRLAAWLVALAVCLALQTVVGRRSAEGEDLLWLHVPLGVALFGLAVQPARVARRIG
jgi:hypothetical protein